MIVHVHGRKKEKWVDDNQLSRASKKIARCLLSNNANSCIVHSRTLKSKPYSQKREYVKHKNAKAWKGTTSYRQKQVVESYLKKFGLHRVQFVTGVRLQAAVPVPGS